MRKSLLCAASLVALAFIASACTVNPTVTAPSSSSSASQVAAVASSTSAAPSVVTVTAKSSTKPKPVHRTVTQVVQQAPAVPASGSSLRSLYASSSSAYAEDYYTGDDEGLFFDAPSQNIGCYLDDTEVQCSIHNYDFPQNGPDCSQGIAVDFYGGSYPGLTPCSGYFPVAHRGSVLAYGSSLTYGNMACVSESAGISCLDLNGDAGFTLSRQAFSPVG